MTALILGFCASSWFGWPPLIVGAVLSLLVAAVGGMFAWRNGSTASALGAPDALRRYLIMGVEFTVAAAGPR